MFSIVPATMPTLNGRIAMVAGIAVLLGALTGCDRTPPGLREWRPSDHSREEGEGEGALPPLEDNDPMIAAVGLYRVQCAGCHGPRGHGDGPQAVGLPVRPPDFGSATFQRSRTDEQLRAVIVHGRGAMPGFGSTLRPEGIDVLVRLIRQLGEARSDE